MAKAKTLDDMVNELLKNYQKATLVAAKFASIKIKEQLYEDALKCLKLYYGFYEPTSYDRTDRLKDSFVPYSRVVKKGDKIYCYMGVEYDYTRLEGYYYSNSYAHDGWGDYRHRSENDDSWKYGGNVDASWIVDNYLDGIHPRTNGATNSEDVKYIPKVDYYKPSAIMKANLNMSVQHFENYMMISFMDQIFKNR